MAFLVGLTFAAVGLTMTALAQRWDFFNYYMTLVLTPMMMISGVFFPLEQLPAPVQAVANALPLAHGVKLARPLVAGDWPPDALLHLAVLLGYAAVASWAAVAIARRRFSR